MKTEMNELVKLHYALLNYSRPRIVYKKQESLENSWAQSEDVINRF